MSLFTNSFNFFKTTISEIFTDPTFLSDIFIHTLILFTFLTCLFIYYILGLSITGFKNNISILIDKLKPKLNNIKEHPIIKENVLNINFKNIIKKTDEEDKYVKNNNNNIKTSLLVINVLLWVFILSIVILYNILIHSHAECAKYDKINWMEELIQNSIIFTIIGIIELVFFNTVIMNYIPVEPSFITKYGLDRLKNKFYVEDTN